MRRALLAFGLLLFVSACESDATSGLDDEPDVFSMRLSIGGQQLSVTDISTTGGPAVIRPGTVNVSATFYGSDNVIDPRVSAAAFQLNVEVLNSELVTFQRSTTNSLAGTLTATAPVANVQLRVALYHIEPQHIDFGPHVVNVVVAN